MADNLEQILQEKPDLVMWEYGANDVTYGKLEEYVKATESAFDKLKAAGIEVVVHTIYLTESLRARGGGHHKVAGITTLLDKLDRSILAHARGSRDDDQHRTRRAQIGIPRAGYVTPVIHYRLI